MLRSQKNSVFYRSGQIIISSGVLPLRTFEHRTSLTRQDWFSLIVLHCWRSAGWNMQASWCRPAWDDTWEATSGGRWAQTARMAITTTSPSFHLPPPPIPLPIHSCHSRVWAEEQAGRRSQKTTHPSSSPAWVLVQTQLCCSISKHRAEQPGEKDTSEVGRLGGSARRSRWHWGEGSTGEDLIPWLGKRI